MQNTTSIGQNRYDKIRKPKKKEKNLRISKKSTNFADNFKRLCISRKGSIVQRIEYGFPKP